MTTLEFAIVDCLVERDGKFLLVQEGREGRGKKWNLPGGHVEPEETLAEAALREVEEESGLVVALTGFLGIYQTVFTGKINVAGPVFLAKVVGGEEKTSAEHPAVRWATADELLAMAAADELWTKYPPVLIKDYLRRGALPLEWVTSNRA